MRNQRVLMINNTSFKISIGHKTVQVTVFWALKKQQCSKLTDTVKQNSTKNFTL